MTIHRRLAWGLCACTLTAGAVSCWVPAETGQKMQADILALQRDTREAQKGLDEQRARLDEQMQQAARQIDEVARALADLRRGARMTDADFGVQIERLIKETQELRGTLELTEYRLGKLEAKLEGDDSLSNRVEALERGLKDVKTAPPKRAPAEPKSKEALMQKGRSLAKSGKVAEARGVFRDIIKRWPDSPGLTDEAYFRLGELYFADKKYRSALQEYIKVAEAFTSGQYVAASLYKIGLCSTELGNLEDAQIFFTEVVKNHRKSPLAKDAAKKLDEVKKRLAKEKARKSGGRKSGKKRK